MRVSVVMANFDGARHLPAAIASVLRQSHADLELLVADDGSTDASVAIVRDWAARDARVRLLAPAPGAAARGPGAARNRALDAATGDWIAVVDSDDLVHPDRLARLLAAADRLGADLVADDLVFFGTAPGAGGRTLLAPLGPAAPFAVGPAEYLAASGEDRRRPALGYLKPVIRRAALGGLRYDPALRVGEDYDLVLRLLLAGARFHVVPDPTYLYRRHPGSVSHRLSVPVAEAMLAAHDRLADGAPAALAPALGRRRAGLARALAYERLVAALKAGRAGPAAAVLARRPGLAAALARSLGERLARRTADARPLAAARPAATIRLGAGAARRLAAPPLAIPFPAPPPPGGSWPAPPGPAAAALSALSERFRLSPEPADPAGDWAAWLLPDRHAEAHAPDGASSGSR